MITAARLIVLGNVSRMRVVKQVSLTFFVIYSEVKNRANENVLFHLNKTEQEKKTLFNSNDNEDDPCKNI